MEIAQKWLDQNYPKEERKEILIITKDDVTKRLSGELSLDNFNELIEMDLSNNNITKLDVSDCDELYKIIVANNRLTELLNHRTPEKLTYLNIMNNNINKTNLDCFSEFINIERLFIGTDANVIKQSFYNRFYGTLKSLKKLNNLKVLDISNTDIDKGLRYLPDSLEEFFYEADLPKVKVTRIKEKLNPFGKKFKNYKKEKLKIIPRKKLKENDELEDQPEINNLLILGRTGSGKSTLANVLSGENNFIESENSVSETKHHEDALFRHSGKLYRVVDTIGLCDTKLPKNHVLSKIAETVYAVREGISQVFFVVGKRFTEEETDTFELLKTILFECDIVKYTTIIRTNFTSFRNPDKCKDDRQKIMDENDFLAKIINSCNGIIHIDAPPINVDSDERLRLNKKDRDESRNLLLKHIESFHGNYKPYIKTWDQFILEIENKIIMMHELDSSAENSEKKEELIGEVARVTEFHWNVYIPLLGKSQICFKSEN
ncbi:4401_t:CDS:1, partial [Dentiscutata heterogama]